MPFCPNCGKEVSKDTKFCPECGKRPIKTQSEQPATSALHREVSGVEQRTHINWFERHLNWTMVLAWVGTNVIGVIVGILIELAEPYVHDETLGGIVIVIPLVLILPVGYWVLRKKNRSMWWLLISGSPFFLLLSNKGSTQVRDEGSFKPD